MKHVTNTRSIGARTAVISAVGLIVASAVVAVVVITSRPTSSGHNTQSLTNSSGTSNPAHGSADMPGMAPDPSHGSEDMPAATSTPDPGHGSDDMPGMAPDASHGSEDMPGASPDSGGHSDVPGASSGHGISGSAADRPLAPVLGTFGGGASAVMLTAGLLRRRDKARAAAKQAARAARKARS